MRLSLRAQLAIAIVLVTLATVVLVLASSQRRLVEEFHRFEGGNDTVFVARAAERLEALAPGLQSSLTWEGADRVLVAIARPPGVELVLLSPAGQVVAATRNDLRSARFSGGGATGRTPTSDPGVVTAPGSEPATSRPVVLTFRDEHTQAVVRLMFDDPPRRVLRRADGRLIGVVYSFYFRLPPGAVAQRTAARERASGGGRGSRGGDPLDPRPDLVSRVLVGPLLLGALVSMVLLFWAASRALSPLDALTAATQRLATGDRSARVTVAGSTEVAELARSFNAMAESLERSEAARRQMVSDVAHELRTPLTNLRCQLEAMQDRLVSADPAALAALHEETVLLSRLVEDLQLLSLADAGALTPERAGHDLRELAARAVTALAARAEAAGVELSLAPGGSVRANCDAERIGQVLRNLVANALEHTPRGGCVTLAASTGVNGGATLSVRDTGAGIAPEHLARVFDRFWRADPARARGSGGAGLGLAIVKQLVALHGGDVSVTSVPGEGTTFVVRLPARG